MNCRTRLSEILWANFKICKCVSCICSQSAAPLMRELVHMHVNSFWPTQRTEPEAMCPPFCVSWPVLRRVDSAGSGFDLSRGRKPIALGHPRTHCRTRNRVDEDHSLVFVRKNIEQPLFVAAYLCSGSSDSAVSCHVSRFICSTTVDSGTFR